MPRRGDIAFGLALSHPASCTITEPKPGLHLNFSISLSLHARSPHATNTPICLLCLVPRSSSISTAPSHHHEPPTSSPYVDLEYIPTATDACRARSPTDFCGGSSPVAEDAHTLCCEPLTRLHPVTMTDVLPAMGHVSSSRTPLRPSSSHTSFFDRRRGYHSPRKTNFSFHDLHEPSASSSQTSSSESTSTSSLSLETVFDESSSDDDLAFPSYGNATKFKEVEEFEAPPSSPIATTAPHTPAEPASVSTPEAVPVSEDDTAVRSEPSQHVDYLSHEWKEEDIWSSWRHIVDHRRVYGERSRLENASWRTWAKQQFKLKTTSPESLNW
jgi:hypothetical protein